MLLRNCVAAVVIVGHVACGQPAKSSRQADLSQSSATGLASHTDSSLQSGPFSAELNESDLGRGVRHVSFYMEDGIALFEGDIALKMSDGSQAQLTELPQGSGEPARAVGLIAASSRWPRATVPYLIDARMPQANAISQAMAMVERDTGIKFVPRTTETDYVNFVPGHSNCWSYLGRVGGAQPISLAPNCDTGTIFHEIGHALGLHHEQNRNDRDTHITVLWENIAPDYHSQFQKAGPTASDMGSYDLKSIMHYGSYFFSVNQKPSMVTKDGKLIVPNTKTLSPGDISALKSMYGGLIKPVSAKRQLVEALLANLQVSCKITVDIVDEQNPSPQFQAILRANAESAKVDFSFEMDREAQKAALDILIPEFLLTSCK